MAQYIQVSGVSFGNGHTDNPTYAFSVGSGDIFLSGSGGYVNSPTGISKATLTSGVNLYLSDDNVTAVTASVESGFTCAGQIAYATWLVPSVTPSITPTPTGTPALGNCQFVFVPDSVDTTGYGLRYNLGGEINTLFAALFGTTTVYGGESGSVYSVCSTLQPLYWQQSTNTTVSYPSGVVYLGSGDACDENTDCEYVAPAPSPTVTPTITATPTGTPVSPTPTPTPSTVESVVTFYVADAIPGVIPVWRANVQIDGTKTINIDVSGSAGGNEGTQSLFVTGTVTGNGTITVTRINPDSTVDDLTTVEVIVTGGSISVLPTGQQNISSGSVANESFTISNLALGDDIRIEVYEG